MTLMPNMFRVKPSLNVSANNVLGLGTSGLGVERI